MNFFGFFKVFEGSLKNNACEWGSGQVGTPLEGRVFRIVFCNKFFFLQNTWFLKVPSPFSVDLEAREGRDPKSLLFHLHDMVDSKWQIMPRCLSEDHFFPFFPTSFSVLPVALRPDAEGGTFRHAMGLARHCCVVSLSVKFYLMLVIFDDILFYLSSSLQAQFRFWVAGERGKNVLFWWKHILIPWFKVLIVLISQVTKGENLYLGF